MKKDRMCTWQQRILIFGRESKPRMLCFISDAGTHGIYLSLTLCTAQFN